MNRFRIPAAAEAVGSFGAPAPFPPLGGTTFAAMIGKADGAAVGGGDGAA